MAARLLVVARVGLGIGLRDSAGRLQKRLESMMTLLVKRVLAALRSSPIRRNSDAAV